MSVTVELIYVPPCTCCAKTCEGLRHTARAILGDKLIWRNVSVVEHFDYAASLGVTALPAVAINGRPAFLSLPTPEQFSRTLEHLVAQDSEAAVADFRTNATDAPSDPVAEPRLLHGRAIATTTLADQTTLTLNSVCARSYGMRDAFRPHGKRTPLAAPAGSGSSRTTFRRPGH
jgi:hypothetical protein